MTDIETYRHTPDMPEISGFGGGYEECCQKMLEAGVKWLYERQSRGMQPDLHAKTLSGVYGILIPNSDDAKALEEAVLEPVKDEGITGAMHHAVMNRLFWIAKYGWPAYCAEMRKPDEERAS